jgi:hypothetical protein
MSKPQWVLGQENPEVPVNEALDILDPFFTYGRDPATTSGLTWGYIGGRWGVNLITAGTLTLTASNINYVVVNRATGALSVSAATTNWNDTNGFLRAWKLTTSAATVTATEDHRAGPGGVNGSSERVLLPPVTSFSGSRTLVLADSNTFSQSTGASAAVVTVPPNASVAFDIGTEVHVQWYGAGAVSVAAGAGVTLRRPALLSLNIGARYGVATLKNIGANEWALFGYLATV